MKYKLHLVSILILMALFSCKTRPQSESRPLKAPKGYMNETFLKISYALGFLDLVDTAPSVPEDIQEFKNIEYKNVDSLSLQLDIYKRKDLKSPAPVLIFIHGGAWRSGQRSDYLPYLIDYANKGYVTATVSYRLMKEATYPAAVQDVNCAIRWIMEHGSDYGMDITRLALVGGSAGAHLAMMVGYGGDNEVFTHDCSIDSAAADIKAIVDLYGPTDFTTSYARESYQVNDFLNVSFEENPDIYKAASPRTYISPDAPPTLIFQGTIDGLVPVSQSDSLAVWLSNAGVPHEYHRLKGWPHTMDLAVKVNEYCQYYMDRFFEKFVVASGE